MSTSVKRSLSVLLSVLLLLGLFSAVSFATAEPVNLVQNGDFETGYGTGWDLTQHSASAPGSVFCKVSADAAKTGNYGVCLRGSGGWDPLASQTVTGLEIGTTYRFSLWYKALSGGVNLALYAGDYSGMRYAHTYATKTEWTHFAVEFEAVDTEMFLYICGSGTRVSEQVYVDDVTLTEVVMVEDEPSTKRMDTLLDNVKTQGRTAMVDGTLMLDFSISGVEFELNCAGDVYATFNARKLSSTSSTGGVYFTIVVDGVKKARDDCHIVSVGETKVKLAENLPAGKHSFAIYRQTEHSYGEVGICALTYDGQILEKPSAKSQTIEFIGDSISCGYGILGSNSQGDGTAFWSDGTQAYPFLTAQALNADWSNVSWSGLGCQYGYSSITMQQVYPAQRYNYDKTTPYSFARQPDVVVLALGTNDNSKQSDSTLKRAGLERMLTLVRQKNPTAPVVWIYNMMTDGVNGMIEDIVKAFGGEKAGYYACRLTRNTAGANWHPNLAGQQRFADELVDFLLDKELCTIEANGGLLTEDGVARMEMTEKLGGLAFRFKLNTKGVTMTEKHGFSLSNATVDALGDGTPCRLVGMGALVTNSPEIGTRPERMMKKNVGKNHVDAPAKYLMKADGGDAWFAVRVTNIPAMFMDTLVYARPYYVFELDGRRIVVYGAIVSAQYEGTPSMNDGVLDW